MAEYDRMQKKQESRAVANNESHSKRLKGVTDIIPSETKRQFTFNYPKGNVTKQLTRAYRVEPLNAKIKLNEERNKIESFDGGGHGIDISFKDSGHAEYYLSSRKDCILISWDMRDDFYDAIIHRIKGTSPKNKETGIWKDVCHLKQPKNSSDSIVTENDWIAPHFGIQWIIPFNKYGKGSNVGVQTHSDLFGTDEPVESNIFKDNDLVCIYAKEQPFNKWCGKYQDKAEFLVESAEEDYLIITKGEAIKKEIAEEEDFS